MGETRQRKPFRKTFLANALLLAGICILIYWLFFGSLSIITKHNDVRIVPDFVGVSLDSAMTIIGKEGFDLKVDSIYDRTKGLHEVVDQQPEAGARVKSGRIIFLTVNKANPPMVTLPNLIGKSFRTIELELKKLNLVVGDTTEVYDIAVGTVIAMKMNGQEIKAGTKIPEGSAIDFVVSKGLGDTKVAIPDLLGKTLDEALKLLQEAGLNYDLRVEGKITDSATALIYDQYPYSRNDYGDVQKVWIGDEIEIRYKQNPEVVKRTYIQRELSDEDIIDVTPRDADENNSPAPTGSGAREGVKESSNNNKTRPSTRGTGENTAGQSPGPSEDNKNTEQGAENKRTRPKR